MTNEEVAAPAGRGAIQIDGVKYETLIMAGETYLERRVVAAMFRRKLGTLRRWARENYGPPYCSIGKEHFYAIRDLDRWLAQNVRTRARTARDRRCAA